LVIVNYPDGQSEELPSENNPEDPSAGHRMMPFGRNLWMERDDFKEEANKKWFRLAPGKTVRLKSAFIVRYVDHVKGADGRVEEVHVEYFPDSKSGSDNSGIKAKGTLHWVSKNHAVPVEIREYDRLFMTPVPGGEDGDFLKDLNPKSLNITTGYAEPSLARATPGQRYQFQRKGYFVVDSESTEEKTIFNKTVALRDTWKKR